jgi:transcriptional/translational regulatory protein YebC/TACO1
MRIKVEQQEEMERMKQKALEQDDESLNEDEQDIVDVDESKEEISTFQEDMDTIADFLVSDSTQFTTKLLQGVPIRAMYSFDEHRKQSPEEQKEALDLLELI